MNDKTGSWLNGVFIPSVPSNGWFTTYTTGNYYYHVLETPSKNPYARVTVGKNRLKVVSGSVYMPDGQEFEIELFNPSTATVLAKVEINGSPMSASGMVLRPGQRVYLERHIDDARKLKFTTYDVENTSEAAEAIANNGLVRVTFHTECQPVVSNNVWWHHSGTNDPNYNNYNTFTMSNSIDHGSVTRSLFCARPTMSMDSLEDFAPDTVETGRVEKGSSSQQSFVEVDMDFEAIAFHIDEFRIKPDSARPAEPRKHCGCGRKVKHKDVYCGGCGSKH